MEIRNVQFDFLNLTESIFCSVIIQVKYGLHDNYDICNLFCWQVEFYIAHIYIFHIAYIYGTIF